MPQSKFKILFGVSLVVFLIVFFHYLGWLKIFENFSRSLINRGSAVVYTISIEIGEKEESFENIEELKESYRNAKEKIIQTEINEAKLKVLEQENEELRQQLNFLQENSHENIGAEVIGKNIDPVGSNIIINRGSNDSIKIGNPVIVYNGIFIGKIIKVHKRTSIVRMLDDGQSKIASTVLGKNYSTGLVEGGYGLSVQMNLIPQHEEISIGDKIITSGLEENIPKGLFIGTVEAIKKEAYQPFQQAILTPAASSHHFTTVSVIIDKPTTN